MTLSHGVYAGTATDLTGTNAAFRKKQLPVPDVVECLSSLTP
jgi:hypothetical protein